MKKILLISFLFLSSLFSLDDYWNPGVVITYEEWDLRMKYCDRAYFSTNERLADSNWQTGDLPLTPTLYEDKGQTYTLGVGELLIYCISGTSAYDGLPSGGTNNVNYSGYKRSLLDKCNGLDIYGSTNSAMIQCDPVTGRFSYIEESMGGTLNQKDWSYDCYTPDNLMPPKEIGSCFWNSPLGGYSQETKEDCYKRAGATWQGLKQIYKGLLYINIFIGKVKIAGKYVEAGFLYGSFACVRGKPTNSKYSQNIKMSSPIRTCVGDGCLNDTLHFDPNDIALLNNKPVGGGTGGGTGGTGGGGASLSDLEPKFAEIKSDINKINHNNTTSTMNNEQ
jgi:hypothetical protein